MSKLKIAALAIGLGAAGTVGVTFGLAQGSDANAINACVDQKGSPRIVAAGAACTKQESPLTWAVQGPPGPQGAPGARGEQGPPGASGHTITIIGDMAITGKSGTPMTAGDGSVTKMDVISYSQGIVSPRDVGSGQATGKRQYAPIKIIKQWDAATPSLLQACATNEVLKAVQLNFHPPGAAANTMQVKLTNASCTSLSQSTDESGNELETLELVFQKIELTHPASNKMFVDDWSVQP